MTLKENVENNAMFIHDLPQPVDNAAHVHVQSHRGASGNPKRTGAEPGEPGAIGFAGHARSLFKRESFNIPVVQRESVVEHWQRTQ
ncbi:hypothetical protein GCM10008949_49240 [Deinococcus humi]|nr:hypothetical protein GCM10008949_49240 [Deinococcus humi]